MLEAWLWLKTIGLDAVMDKVAPPEMRKYKQFVKDSVAKRTAEELKIQSQKPTTSDGKPASGERKDMFHYLFQARDPDTGRSAYTPEELTAEGNLLIVAGADTTVVVLCGLFFYLSRNADPMARVTAELRRTFSSSADIRSGPTLTSRADMRTT